MRGEPRRMRQALEGLHARTRGRPTRGRRDERLGVLLVQQGRASEAVPWFERALSVSPDFVEARLNLGIAWQEQGNKSRAAEAYRKVLDAPQSNRARSGGRRQLLASSGRLDDQASSLEGTCVREGPASASHRGCIGHRGCCRCGASRRMVAAGSLGGSRTRDATGVSQRRRASLGKARSVVLVTIDTLRADRVGVYGARGVTTPNFDGVARRGVRFTRAYANARSRSRRTPAC